MAHTPKAIRKNKMGYIPMIGQIDIPASVESKLKASEKKQRKYKKALKKWQKDIVTKAEKKRG